MSLHYYEVLTPRGLFNYIYHEEIALGSIVRVSLGKKLHVGLVMKSSYNQLFSYKKLELLPYRLDSYYMDFIYKFSLHNFINPHRVFNNVLKNYPVK